MAILKNIFRSMAGALATVLLTLSMIVPAAAASESVNVPPSLQPNSINSLGAKMDSAQTQAFASLVDLLQKSVGQEPSAPASDANAIALIKQWIAGFGDAVISSTVNLPVGLADYAGAISRVFAGKTFGQTMALFGWLAVALIVGLIGEFLFRKVTRSMRNRVEVARPVALLDTLNVLGSRAVLEVGGVIVFAIACLVAIRFVLPEGDGRMFCRGLILYVIVMPRIVSAILRFNLAPNRRELRLVSTDDWTAQYIYRSFVGLAFVGGTAMFLSKLSQYYGSDSANIVRFWVSLGVHGWIIYVTWKARHGLTTIIVGDEKHLTAGLKNMATYWPPISMAVIALNWFLIQFIVSTGNRTLSPERGAVAILLIVLLPFFDTMIRGIAGHLVPAMEGEGDTAEKAQGDTRECYIRIGRVVLLIVMVMLIGKLWGIDFRNLAESGLGAQIAANGVSFLVIVAVGYMAWEITNLVINRKLTRELEESGVGGDSDGEAGGAGLTRMATILPILRMTLQVTIIVLTILLGLTQLGINITPLLAGFGVLGLAIGFGAQTLVKDIVSGVFFLLDDAFRAGEFIDIGGTDGTVEKISVRSLQLRSTTGPIHVVPYGSISQLTNNSRDWVTMKLKFTIPFGTDIDMVRKLFKKIGEEMMEDPELAPKFLSPFKGQGANDVTDVGILVRGKFTTLPGDQWAVRKQVYLRVQKAFEKRGIEFARKEVRVVVSDQNGNTLSEQDRAKIGGAAAEGAEVPAKA